MSKTIKYYEVRGPGMRVIKCFKEKKNAEAFAESERERRMKDLSEKSGYTQGEIKGETTYRTWGIIVKENQLELSDTDISESNALEFWANANHSNYPPGF